MKKKLKKTTPHPKVRGKSKHVLAVILKTLGRQQKNDCPAVFGYSRDTIKKIIKGKFPYRAATRISERTDLAMEWLLAGNGGVPPWTRAGKPFTQDSYREYRMQRNNPTITVNKPNALTTFPFIVIRVARLMAAAEVADKSSETKWKLFEAINSIAADFPSFKKEGHDFEMSVVNHLLRPQKGRGFNFMKPIETHLKQAVTSRR